MDPWALASFATVLLPGETAVPSSPFPLIHYQIHCVFEEYNGIHAHPLTSCNSVGDACYHIEEAEVDCDKTIHGHPCCVIR